MLKNWKINSKFLLAIALLGFISLAGLIYVTQKFSSANEAYTGFLQHESTAATYGPRGAAGLWTSTTWLTRALAQDPTSAGYKDLAGRFTKEFEGARKRLLLIPDEVPSRKAAIDEIVAAADGLKATGDAMLKAHEAGDNATVASLGEKLDAAIVNLSPMLGANNSAMAEILNSGTEALSAEVSSTITGALIALLVGIAAAVVISLLIAQKTITAPMTKLRQSMALLADGDTDRNIDGLDRKDEIGQMAAAVAVFRDNAIERKRLEREAEESLGLTERERQEREAQKAREAEDVRFAVDNLARGLSHLSEGDVSYRIATPFTATLDEVRGNFNMSAEKLQAALEQVAGNARSIEAGSAEIRSSADDLAKRTEQQAAAVEETAAALEEITTTVKDAARRAQEAGNLVSRTRQGAEKSGRVVQSAVEAMEQIEKSSSEISNIIGVIDEIAFQTNLLALNAGVEAARAGEAGKGFAVVAQEVRELAQRSANAAKEIKTLITASNDQVRNGVQLVGDTGKALESIVSEVQEISRHVDAIVESAQEQSSGLQQINTAVNQMDQDTQKNAAMVEESTAASHSLSQEVNALNGLLRQFKLSEAPRGATPARSAVQAAPRAAAKAAPARVATAQSAASPSPARALAGKLATAFSGNAAIKSDEWEEF